MGVSSPRWALALGPAVLLGGCHQLPFGARPLVPPETGIYAAALYTSAERSRFDQSGPVSLRILCNVPNSLLTTISYQEASTVSDIDLLSSISGNSSVSGLSASAVSADLKGSLSDYYELKLTNVVKKSVSEEEARAVFARFMARPRCQDAYLASSSDRTVYQLLAVYVGDVQFGVKQGGLFSADVALKLKSLEPKVKAKLQQTYNLSFNGRQMVGAVETVNR